MLAIKIEEQYKIFRLPLLNYILIYVMKGCAETKKNVSYTGRQTLDKFSVKVLLEPKAGRRLPGTFTEIANQPSPKH